MSTQNLTQAAKRKKRIYVKQLAANRANAKKSTGPRSVQGKEIVRFNGLKHGLAGKLAFLPGQDRQAYDELHREFQDHLHPTNDVQRAAIRAVADAFWRLDQVHAVENSLFSGGESDFAHYEDPNLRTAFATARNFLNHAGDLALLSLYEQRINCTLHKNRTAMRIEAKETDNTQRHQRLIDAGVPKWLWLCE